VSRIRFSPWLTVHLRGKSRDGHFKIPLIWGEANLILRKSLNIGSQDHENHEDLGKHLLAGEDALRWQAV